MKNVWKGLIVGGLTGVLAGFVLDGVARASKKAAALGDQVLEHAPEAGRWVQTVTDKAGDWFHDADVPEHVKAVAQKVKDSDAASRVADVGHDIAVAAREKASAHSG
jgi:hypothetical protein